MQGVSLANMYDWNFLHSPRYYVSFSNLSKDEIIVQTGLFVQIAWED